MVAELVAKHIVDRLEIIEVDQDEAEAAPLCIPLRIGLVEGGAVGEPGQGS